MTPSPEHITKAEGIVRILRKRDPRIISISEPVELIANALSEAETKGWNGAVDASAKECEKDWPVGMPAQAIEYRTSEILAKNIRSLKRSMGE